MRLGDWRPREILIYCDNHHDEVEIGRLTSGLRGADALAAALGPDGEIPDGVEYWEPSGPHVELEEGVPAAMAEAPAHIVALAASAASRYVFDCPACPLDVQAGDRLGGRQQRPGYRSVLGTATTGQPLDTTASFKRGVARSFATDVRLSAWADSGESRLALSGLDYILKL